MIESPDAEVVDRFRAALGRRCGWIFEDAKLGFLSEVLARRVVATRLSLAEYVDRLAHGTQPRDELGELAVEITVPETYFFRHRAQFAALAGVVLPARMAARAPSRMLNLLSAGCASGEEAYSLAITARERSLDAAWAVSIHGCDINPAALRRAERGVYSTWSLRETSAEAKKRFFEPEGREFLLHPGIRESVTFHSRNLLGDNGTTLPESYYDVVFCRNVIMYMAPECAARVIARLSRALAPGGYLFLGHAETLRGLSQDFHLRHTHETFYYQRRDHREATLRPRSELPAERPSRPAERPTARTVERPSRPAERPTERPAERPLRPTDRTRASTERDAPATKPPSAPPSVRANLGAALALLAEERFEEALAALDAVRRRGFERDPELLLLRAVLLTQSKQFTLAEMACLELLGADELQAGAHYLRALCREGAGDFDGAADHDRTAAYLNPSFAMPRLHLGLMARRRGDHEAARRNLGEALVLLRRDEPSRLLLFGGGVGRDSLVRLCSAELERLGPG